MLAMILTVSIVVLCGVDLWCKFYVEKYFKRSEEQKICGGKICLRKVHNEGMAFNIGDKTPKAVRIISAVICGVLSIYYVILLGQSGESVKKTGMAWILARHTVIVMIVL